MTDGYLDPLVDTMTCVLNVNVQDSTSYASASAKVWYTSTNTIQIDGGSTSGYRKYAGFFVTRQALNFAGGAVVANPVSSLGQAANSIATNFHAGSTGTNAVNGVSVTLQLSASDFIASPGSYKGALSHGATPTSSGSADYIANYPALRTMPFAPNKASASDDKTLIVQLYGHTTVGTASGSTTRVAPTLWLGAQDSPAASTGTFNQNNADANLRFYPTDWAALEPSGSTAGLLSFDMAKDKWGQTCENSASVATTLWCNTGSGGGGTVYTALTTAGSGGAGTDIEGTVFGATNNLGTVGDILVFKSKPVTSPQDGGGNAGGNGFAVVATSARDFIIHSQSSTAVGAALAGNEDDIRPWNMDWTFTQGATADAFFAMPSSWSAIRGRGGFGTGNANQKVMQRFFQLKTSKTADT